MTSARLRDTDLRAAAALLAAAEDAQDGWLPEHRTTEPQLVDHRDATSWETRLRRLVSRHPQLMIAYACSDRYPINLNNVASRPAILFVEGTLNEADARAAAVVGSRNATPAALDMASNVAGALAAAGATVVSGLARGIDTAAHEGALAAPGRTVAVMGTGIGVVFPTENTELASRIRERGALVTQFPPGYGPTKTTFPARNAVIAGMSRCSVVMTASERSGTQIEINHTIEQNKPVLLWAPLLHGQAWANELAQHPLVRFVDSAQEILAIVDAFPAS
jgi:DNA processing protein